MDGTDSIDDQPPFRSTQGVPIRYLDQGEGPVVVLVHGSLTDARYWLRSAQFQGLARNHRVIAPSRRHNYPNLPGDTTGEYSATDDAADLVTLIRGLDVGPVYLLGHSYGAYASLLATIEAPELIRALVLAEPPIMRWLPHLESGQGVWESFEARVWRPMGEEFRNNGDRAGLDFTADWYFGKPFSDIEPSWQSDFTDSVREWRELATSTDAFPFVPFDRVSEIRVPTLVLSAGNNAGGFNDLIDRALCATIPGAKQVVVPDVSHEMFLDAPDLLLAHLTAFFASVS